MPPAYEVLLLNTAIPQIQAAQSGDTYVVPRDIAFSAALTLSAGTANGVPYLNASKVLTTGSALTFDGTNLGLGTATATGFGRTFAIASAAASNRGFLFKRADTNADTAFLYSDDNNFYLGSNAGPVIFSASNTEQMRLTSTGLGIGTSSPKIQEWRAGTYLTVANASTRGQVEIDGAVADSGSASLGALIFTYSTNTTNHKDVALIEAISSGVTANQRGGVLNFYTKANGTASPALNMTLDSSGNLGLGVTPSAWGGSFKAFQIVSGGTSLWSDGSVAFYNRNTFYDGTNRKYVVSGYAQEYAQLNDGSHAWKITSSGNANDPITFTQAMTLDASGNLKLGGTADRATTVGTNHLDIFNGTAPVGTLTNGISIYSSSGEAYVMDAAGNATLFSPHDAETNEWIFKSKHTPTGKVLKIDVERLLKFVNDHFGLDAVHEFVEE